MVDGDRALKPMRHHLSSTMAYISRVFAPEDDRLRAIREAASEAGKEGIQISAVEGQILFLLSGLNQSLKIVEIGTLFGYSTLWLGRSLPAHGHIWSIERHPAHFQKAQELLVESDIASRLTLIQGDAKEVLPRLLPNAPFDLVFIDANKSAYPDYLAWAEQATRKGGLIIGDNTLLFGAVTGEQPAAADEKTKAAMNAFNERLADRQFYRSVLLPTPEGLTVAQKL